GDEVRQDVVVGGDAQAGNLAVLDDQVADAGEVHLGHVADLPVLGGRRAGAFDLFLKHRGGDHAADGQGAGEPHEFETAANHRATPVDEGERGTNPAHPGRGHSSGILPARISRFHSSSSGQDTAQVPKSAMCWYFVSRSMAFWRIFRSFRKTGPWLGSR